MHSRNIPASAVPTHPACDIKAQARSWKWHNGPETGSVYRASISLDSSSDHQLGNVCKHTISFFNIFFEKLLNVASVTQHHVPEIRPRCCLGQQSAPLCC